MRPTVSWTVIDCRIRVTDGIAVGSRGGWRLVGWLVGIFFFFWFGCLGSRLRVLFLVSILVRLFRARFSFPVLNFVSGDDVQNGGIYVLYTPPMQKGRVRISGAATVSCHVSRSCVVRSSASVHAPRRTRLAIHAPHLETVAFAFIAEPTKCRAPLDFRFFVRYIRSFRSFARSVPYLRVRGVRFSVVAFSWFQSRENTQEEGGVTGKQHPPRSVVRGTSRPDAKRVAASAGNRLTVYTRTRIYDGPFAVSYFSRFLLYTHFFFVSDQRYRLSSTARRCPPYR